jgi:hypothetical protein
MTVEKHSECSHRTPISTMWSVKMSRPLVSKSRKKSSGSFTRVGFPWKGCKFILQNPTPCFRGSQTRAPLESFILPSDVIVGLLGPIWTYLGPSGPIWAYLCLSGPIWTYLDLFGAIWAYLGLSGPIWVYVGLFGHIWAYFGPCGPLWTYGP